jgi:hypothetical protein
MTAMVDGEDDDPLQQYTSLLHFNFARVKRTIYAHLRGPIQQVSGKGDAEAAEDIAANCDAEGEGEGEGDAEGEVDGDGEGDEQPALMTVLRLVAHPALCTFELEQGQLVQQRNELATLSTSKSYFGVPP